HQILDDEFDINDATPPVLDDHGDLLPLRRALAGKLVPHALAHAAHVVCQLARLPSTAEGLCANVVELALQAPAASHGAGAHQCLMLPGPRILILIADEGLH